jgi:E3 Ubiquitin ligase
VTTFLILLLFAIIFLVAGGVLLYLRNKNKQKAALMGRTETSNASDVSGLAPGTLVEVKGTLRCEEPLTSEMAGEGCAYYSSKVVREYLERDYDDDDAGSDRRSEVVAQNEQVAPFTVEDETGSVAVNAEGAEVDAREVVNRFERNTGGDGPSISLGVRPSSSAAASEL